MELLAHFEQLQIAAIKNTMITKIIDIEGSVTALQGRKDSLSEILPLVEAVNTAKRELEEAMARECVAMTDPDMENKNTVPVDSVNTGDNQQPTIKWSVPDPIPLDVISWDSVPSSECLSSNTLVWDEDKEREVEWYTVDQLESITEELELADETISKLGWDGLMLDANSEEHETVAMGLGTISTLSGHSMGVGDLHDIERFSQAIEMVQEFYDDWLTKVNSETNRHYGVDFAEVDGILLNCKQECVNEYAKLCEPK